MTKQARVDAAGRTLEPPPARDDPRFVRPYLVTAGRTRPTHDLAPEALVLPTVVALMRVHTLAFERRRIVERYDSPVAVAEIAAHLDVPLGAVQVLAADMVDEGLLERFATVGERPERELLLRLLHGIENA